VRKATASSAVAAWELRLVGIIVVTLVAFGIVAVYGASSIWAVQSDEPGSFFARRQIVGALVGIVVLLVATRIDYHVWQRNAWLILGAVVLVLIVPATVGLFVLAEPVIALLFQHGAFAQADTAQTTLALRYYLVGLVGASIDLPLVFAFYARQDTFRPAMVGVLGVVFYLLVALPTYRTLGMIGLILANDAQLVGHALIMVMLFQRRIGTLGGLGIGETLLKSLLASAVMGIAVYGTMWGVELLLPSQGRLLWAVTVLVGGSIGLGSYLGLCALLQVNELQVMLAIALKFATGKR